MTLTPPTNQQPTIDKPAKEILLVAKAAKSKKSKSKKDKSKKAKKDQSSDYQYDPNGEVLVINYKVWDFRIWAKIKLPKKRKPVEKDFTCFDDAREYASKNGYSGIRVE